MKKNTELTIFTPVYNRPTKLKELYNSLLAQTDNDFIWLIIDDGSNDDTPEIISNIASQGGFDIITCKQKNQGKHVAHNKAVSMCTTEWCVCVDSDDLLVPTAVEEIKMFIKEHRDDINDSIAGVIAWKGVSETEKIGKKPKNIQRNSLRTLYSLMGMTGDTMLIFRTNVIKKFPFPVFENERFLRESITYNLIDNEYEYLILDRILYLADYYEDGLSRNASLLEIKNPKGAAMFRWDEYSYSTSCKSKIRNLVSYVFFNRLASNNKESIERLGVEFFPLWLLSWSGFIRYRKCFWKKNGTKHESHPSLPTN